MILYCLLFALGSCWVQCLEKKVACSVEDSLTVAQVVEIVGVIICIMFRSWRKMVVCGEN